jgi:dTDP-4-dehydrorhamnose 3,5-epimerase
MIKDVQLKKLNPHFDDRGFLVEILKETDLFFKPLKQTTYTETYPGVIKAFHWHKKQWDFWFVVRGMAQIVLYDLREGSPTKGETNVFYLGEKNLAILAIPPGVAHGYRVLGNQPLGLFYHTSEIYDPKNPDEERIPFDDKTINFDWQTHNR